MRTQLECQGPVFPVGWKQGLNDGLLHRKGEPSGWGQRWGAGPGPQGDAHTRQRQALCGLVGRILHVPEVGAVTGFPSQVFAAFGWRRLQNQCGFLQCVDHDAWTLFRHERGHFLWPISSLLRCPVCQRLRKEPESPKSPLCFLSVSGRAGFQGQLRACPPGSAGLLSHTGHNFLLSPNDWDEKYGNASYNIGHGTFLWLLFHG